MGDDEADEQISETTEISLHAISETRTPESMRVTSSLW